MPFEKNLYFTHGAFQHYILFCQSLASYNWARDSTCQYPCPYPSPAAIALCMENDEDWYTHASCNLHLVNLLFQAHIQTAHWMSQCVDCFPNQDRVLECLMAKGLFDWHKPDHIHIAEVHANRLSVVLMERVLERVENLETRVSFLFCDIFFGLILCPRWRFFALNWMLVMHPILIFTQYLGGWRHWSTICQGWPIHWLHPGVVTQHQAQVPSQLTCNSEERARPHRWTSPLLIERTPKARTVQLWRALGENTKGEDHCLWT